MRVGAASSGSMRSALEADFRVGGGRAAQEWLVSSFQVRAEEGAEVASLDRKRPPPVDRTDRQLVAQPGRQLLERCQSDGEAAGASFGERWSGDETLWVAVTAAKPLAAAIPASTIAPRASSVWVVRRFIVPPGLETVRRLRVSRLTGWDYSYWSDSSTFSREALRAGTT